MMNNLFGPLDASYCNYFYFLSVIAFVSFVGTCVTCVSCMLGKKKANLRLYLALCVQSLFGYFMNRLLYSMCVGSLN